MKSELKIVKFNLLHIISTFKIYSQSFDKFNRFPFVILLFNVFRKKANLYLLFKKNELCTFIYIINYKDMDFVLYLAVNKRYRNNGYGSYLLKWYLNNKLDKTIYLNIDEINNNFEDNYYRKYRLNFYLKNGFYLTNYLINSCDHKGHILSNLKIFDIEKYIKFDKQISKWFFTSEDKIEKDSLLTTIK